MELTKEQERLIETLSRINDFNLEFKEQKETVKNVLQDVDRARCELLKKEQELEIKAQNKLNQLLAFEKDLNLLIKEKSLAFPWLAEAILDYIYMKDGELAAYLRHKKNPAAVSAEKVKEIASEKKVLTKQLLLTRYRLKYYEALFPFLTEYNEEDIDELLLQIVAENKEHVTIEDDPVKQFVTEGEYINLTSSQRNQKALDRYLASHKTPSQIGRDYERYVGYIYELKGYNVSYFGIKEGLEDLGRDLICNNNGSVEIIQCKCWAGHKTIHEKHINQLFGTTVKYYIDYYAEKEKYYNFSLFPELLRGGNIKPVFYTSTKLSENAKKFAEALGVEFYENEQLKPYPIIKCHINKQSKEKLYHLPFDQMYDRTILEKKHGEFYAMTVQEAEQKGFRRAWRWMG